MKYVKPPMDAAYLGGVHRQAAGGVTVRESSNPQSGFTEFSNDDNPKVVTVSVPPPSGNYQRVVRLHEQLHSRMTRMSNKDSAKLMMKHGPFMLNIAEDMRIHLRHRDANNYKPDLKEALTETALTDIENVKQGLALGKSGAPNAVDIYNKAVLTAARSKALDPNNTVINDFIIEEFGLNVFSRIKSAVRDLEHCTRLDDEWGESAFDELEKLMVKPKLPAGKIPGSGPGGKSGETPGEGSATIRTDAKFPWRIFRPPLTKTKIDETRQRRKTTSGKLNIRACIRAKTSGIPTCKLFTAERTTEGGGTVLIDCSGSMSPTPAILLELATLMPGALIAGYSEDVLVILADKGRAVAEIPGIYQNDDGDEIPKPDDEDEAANRFSTIFPGGNDSDYWAIEWLLEQPGPYTYIGDGELCGETAGWGRGQAKLANQLLVTAEMEGQLTWYKSYTQALEKLKAGKKNS